LRSLFLVNPRAKRVDGRGSILRAVADKTDTPLRLLDGPIEPTESADRVYIEGGDGTVRDVVSTWLKSGLRLPEFVIVRGGTTDQVAGLLGLKRKTVKGVEASLTSPLKPCPVRLLKIEADSETHFGFLLSTGAIPQVTKTLEKYRGPEGLSGARLVTRAIADATKPNSEILEATDAKVSLDLPDEHLVLDGAHLGTMSTTLPGLYLGLDPFWGEQSGALRVTYASGDAQGLVPTILGQWVGRQNVDVLARRGFQSYNVDHFSIITDAPIMLDGDLLVGRKLSVSASQHVTFMR